MGFNCWTSGHDHTDTSRWGGNSVQASQYRSGKRPFNTAKSLHHFPGENDSEKLQWKWGGSGGENPRMPYSFTALEKQLKQDK